MGKVIKLDSFKNGKDKGSEGIGNQLMDEFFRTNGTMVNTELKPAYLIKFNISNGWDGKVIEVSRLSKAESYLSSLGSGTCGLYNVDTEKDKIMQYIIAELDSDIEATGAKKDKFSMVLVFNEELEEWVFNAAKEGKLFLSVT